MQKKHDETAHLLSSPRNAERLLRSIRASESTGSSGLSARVRGQPFEDFLLKLIEQHDAVLKRIPTYLDGYLAEFRGDRSLERRRLAAAFKDKAADNALSRQVLELILK
jgi:hypothetical protein